VDVNKLFELISAEEMEKALEFAESVPEYLRDAFVDALLKEAAFHGREGRYELEIRYLEVALKIVADNKLKSKVVMGMSISYYNWGNSLFGLSELESEPSKKEELLLESCKKYKEAVNINPNLAEAYSNWGNSLSDLSELESEPSKKEELLLEGCKKYKEAVNINPDYAEAYSNWGTSLFGLSRLESEPSDREKLLLESCKKYKEAVDINPNLAEAYSNWGMSLFGLSRLESEPSKKEELLLESCRKYEKAVDINPNYAEAYYNWGMSLFGLSELESKPSKKEELLLESCRKYEKAVNINPNYAKAYANHGIALLFLNTALDTAEGLFVKASQIFHGIDSDKARALQEWTKARGHMNRREWGAFRERMLEVKRIFEEIHDPLAESASASIQFSYIDEQLERVLEEPNAIQALEKMVAIFQNLPELSSLPGSERIIYQSRLAAFGITGNFIAMLLNIDSSTDLSHLEKDLKKLLDASQEIEAACELMHFSPGKRAIVDIAYLIEDSFKLIENLQNAPETMRKNIVSNELETLWKRISVAIPLLNGEWSAGSENVTISKQLSSFDKKLETIHSDVKDIRRIGERTLEIVEDTKNLIIRKDVVRSEYLFEIREPLILRAFLPVSNRLRIIVRLGTLTDSEIEDIIDSVKRLNARGRKMIINKLKKLKEVDKRLLEILEKIRSLPRG